MLALLVAGVVAWAAGGAEPAQGIVVNSGSRLVHLYDFEEVNDQGVKIGRALGNAPEWYPIGRDPQESDAAFLRQPLHELLQGRRGYPGFNVVRMDDKAAASGDYSLLLGMQGGNVGAYLEVGALPCVPSSDYQIACRVRTLGLSHAAARLSAYFIDAQGRLLETTRVESAKVRTQGQWVDLVVKLMGDEPRVAWIGVELELLQPEARIGHPLGDEQVLVPDIQGKAWFDDVAVWQLPNVRIETNSDVNTLSGEIPGEAHGSKGVGLGAGPELTMRVRDLSGQQLQASVTVYDDQMRPVAHHERTVGAGAPSTWRWAPKLPGYGWYYADLIVRDDRGEAGQLVAARSAVAMLWLSDELRGGAERVRFGVSAEGAPDSELMLLPELIEATGLGSAVISAWRHRVTLSDMEAIQAQRQAIIERLLSLGCQVTLSMEPMPAELAQAVGQEDTDALTVFEQNKEAWRAYLTPVVMRHGQRVHHWQIGSSSRGDTFFEPDLIESTAGMAAELRMIAPGPTLVLPWRLDQAPAPELSEDYEYALAVPPGITPNDLGAYLAPWQAMKGRVTLELEMPDAASVPQHLRVRDLVIRTVRAWEQGVAGVNLRRPWTMTGARSDAHGLQAVGVESRSRQTVLMPDPILGAFASTARRLGGRRVIGEMPVEPGVVCLILDGPAGGALVLWNESAEQPVVLTQFLGDSAVKYDMWGNRSAIEMVNGRMRNHRLEIGRDPIFIEGIDAPLAVFHAGFVMDEPLIESTQSPHERAVTLINPWPYTISGTLTFTGPAGWQALPTRHYFSIASGRSVKLPVTLTFPVAEVAGEKKLTAHAEFRAAESYDISLATPIELGLPGVDFQATLSYVNGEQAGTKDAIVTAVVTNHGDEPRSLYVFASLAGHPRAERAVPRLEPGESAVRSFRFTGAAAALAEHDIRTGVREMNGPAILNQVLSLDGMK